MGTDDDQVQTVTLKQTREQLAAEYDQACAEHRDAMALLGLAQAEVSKLEEAAARTQRRQRETRVALLDSFSEGGNVWWPVLAPAKPPTLTEQEHDVWVKAYTAARDKHSTSLQFGGAHGPAGVAGVVAAEANAAVAAYRKLRDEPAVS